MTAADAAAARAPVIATPLEQEHLLRALESGAGIANRRQFFLWSQGQLQALLPHAMLVAPWLDVGGRLLRCVCLHGGVRDARQLEPLVHPQQGLVVRLARAWAGEMLAPCWVDGEGELPPGVPALRSGLARQVLRAEPGPALLCGSGPLAGGSAFFALLGMRQPPSRRAAHFLELLLPCLLLALQRADAAPPAPPPLSAREAQVVHWVREGKSNAEIGEILGISALTVKSHLQKIFRRLGVHTRAQLAVRSAS